MFEAGIAERAGCARTVLVVSMDAAFCEEVKSQLDAKCSHLRVMGVGTLAEAVGQRPAAMLLEESALRAGEADGERSPSLWAAASSLAEVAPTVVVGPPEQQMAIASLLAAGKVDYVVRRGAYVEVAVGLLERRLRQGTVEKANWVCDGTAAGCVTMEKIRAGAQAGGDFGEILRHELNNPLTGILGNAELLLVELRRRRIELPKSVEARLETIASLAVRMRETVRMLSERWAAEVEGDAKELMEDRK